MARENIITKLNELREEYKTAEPLRKQEIMQEGKALKEIKMVCYLDGCLREADSELTAFCSENHKAEYNKRKPVERIGKLLSIEEIQERLLQMGREKRLKDQPRGFSAAQVVFKEEKAPAV